MFWNGDGDDDIIVPKEHENADIIDSIVDEKENNDFLGGEGGNEELDHLQDVIGKIKEIFYQVELIWIRYKNKKFKVKKKLRNFYPKK